MSVVFLCSQFPLPSFSGLGKTKFGTPTVSVLKDILDGPLPFASTRNLHHLVVSSKQADGDTNDASPQRSSRGRTSEGDEFEGKESSKNPEEIISLFRKIQSSISKGTATSKNVPPVESVLEALRQSTAKGKAARKKANDMLSTDTKSPRLPSNQGSEDDKYVEIPETKEDASQKFKSMKVAELKERAKAKGIRGCSKLRKDELVNLLLMYY